MAKVLISQGQPVTVATRHSANAAPLRDNGAEVPVVDVADPYALRTVFQTGKRASLPNPPVSPSSDPDVTEHWTMASIVAALDGYGLATAVAQAT